MRLLTIGLLIIVLLSCNKIITIELPAYESQIVVEMYLEEGKPLRCLVSESLPYTDTAISRELNDAMVIFSDGSVNDTLVNIINEDTETGRWYNYFNPGIMLADSTKTYTIKISDSSNRLVTGTTQFSQRIISIDSINIRSSANEPDSFSVGIIISDPGISDNYYRFLITKKLNDFNSEDTDFFLSDLSFNGNSFSFYSNANYARNDTVLVRVYSLLKEYYDYLQSTENARNSNFNPFTQPALIKSNVKGGLGIFTAIRYDQRQIMIR
jgi:hypothetical protein